MSCEKDKDSKKYLGFSYNKAHICYSPVYTLYTRILLHSELQFGQHEWEENEKK
jgi:hypothetical protein